MYLSVKVLSESEFNTTVRIFKSLGFTWDGKAETVINYDGAKWDDDFFVEINYKPDRIFFHNGNWGFNEEAGGGHEILDFIDFISLFDVFVNDKPFANRDVDFASIVNKFKNNNKTTEKGNGKIMTKIDLSSLTKQQVSAITSIKDRVSDSYYPLYALLDRTRDDAKGFGDDDENLYQAIDAIGDREIELQVVDFLFNKNTEFEIDEQEQYIVASRFKDEDGDTSYLLNSQGSITYDREDAQLFDTFEEAKKATGPFGKVLKAE